VSSKGRYWNSTEDITITNHSNSYPAFLENTILGAMAIDQILRQQIYPTTEPNEN